MQSRGSDPSRPKQDRRGIDGHRRDWGRDRGHTDQALLDTDGDGVTGMDDMIAHIEYIAALVGIDHVGIATDAYVDGWELNSQFYPGADLAALDRWVRLTARLRVRGWSEEDLAKLLGGNFLRVFREILRSR